MCSSVAVPECIIGIPRWRSRHAAERASVVVTGPPRRARAEASHLAVSSRRSPVAAVVEAVEGSVRFKTQKADWLQCSSTMTHTWNFEKH